ncbi:hypothetical protein F66182_7818 [Fusarium sp. NRRL 66182]|nr:hypothetical protein F66182_7818 [Fusarium sp. NRRL 66182]
MGLFALLSSPFSGAQQTQINKDLPVLERLNRASDKIDDICRSSGVPGASIGVVHNGHQIHTHSYGYRDVAKGSPTTSQSVFGIGSLTKSFVAAALAQLVDQEMILWDTPVRDVLPEFHHRNPIIEETLTVADILSHRSGLAGLGDMNLAFQGDGDMLLPKSSLYHLVEQFPTLFPLRSDWNYLVWGYSLAGEIIEKLTGTDVPTYVQEHVLTPLGLNASTFDPDSVDPDRLAEPYAGLSDGTAFRLNKRQVFKDTFFEASGGMYSNLDDLIKWSKALLQEMKPETKSKHETIKQIESLISNHAPIANPSLRERSYAYGWARTQLPNVVGFIGDNVDLWEDVRDHPLLGSQDQPLFMIYHQGSTVGYYTFVALFPDTQSAVVVLINSIAISDAADWIARLMIQALFDLHDGQDYVALSKEGNRRAIKEFEVLAEKISAKRYTCQDMPLSDLRSFIGRYQHTDRPFHIDILAHPSNDSKLIFQFQGLKDQTYELRHLCGYEFEWALTHDESKKRGRYNNAELEAYLFKFNMSEDGDTAVSFSWATDPVLPERKDVFLKSKERHLGLQDQNDQVVVGP